MAASVNENKMSKDKESENLINKNVLPNKDKSRSWDNSNQLDRGNDKEKLAGSDGAGINPDDSKNDR